MHIIPPPIRHGWLTTYQSYEGFRSACKCGWVSPVKPSTGKAQDSYLRHYRRAPQSEKIGDSE